MNHTSGFILRPWTTHVPSTICFRGSFCFVRMFKFIKLFSECVCEGVYAMACHSMHAEVRKTTWRRELVGSLLQPRGSQGSNSGCPAWWSSSVDSFVWQNVMVTTVWAYLWVLCSVPLISMSVFTPVLCFVTMALYCILRSGIAMPSFYLGFLRLARIACTSLWTLGFFPPYFCEECH